MKRWRKKRRKYRRNQNRKRNDKEKVTHPHCICESRIFLASIQHFFFVLPFSFCSFFFKIFTYNRLLIFCRNVSFRFFFFAFSCCFSLIAFMIDSSLILIIIVSFSFSLPFLFYAAQCFLFYSLYRLIWHIVVSAGKKVMRRDKIHW